MANEMEAQEKSMPLLQHVVHQCRDSVALDDTLMSAEFFSTKRRKLDAWRIIQGSPSEQRERVAFSDDEIEDSQDNSNMRVVVANGCIPHAQNNAGVHPLSLRGIALVKPKQKGKVRTKWTAAEIENLRRGVLKFEGMPNLWARILNFYKFEPCRTSVDLKDKWRNMQKET